MTKTKAQLRAEAVERLKELGGDIPSPQILKALYTLYNPFVDDDLHILRDALIDLLTDDGAASDKPKATGHQVLEAVKELQLDLTAFCNTQRGIERLEKHCDHQRKRICELDAKYEAMKAERDVWKRKAEQAIEHMSEWKGAAL